MATSTTNLGLIKPGGTDKIRIAQINQNMDIIDSAIGAAESGTTLQEQITSNKQAIVTQQESLAYIVGNTNTTGNTLAVGQFVYVKGHSTITEGLRTVTASISANGNITTSNTSACSEGGLNALNSKIEDNQYSTSGLFTSKCSIQAGGYHKLGKLVVVNIRVTATASDSCDVTGFPVYSGQFNSNIVSCSIVNIGDSLFANSPCFIRRDGSMTFIGENGKTYAISTVYMCD